MRAQGGWGAERGCGGGWGGGGGVMAPGGSPDAARMQTPSRAGARLRRARNSEEGGDGARTPFGRLTKGLKGKKGARAVGFAARLLDRSGRHGDEAISDDARILDEMGHLSVAPTGAVKYFEGEGFSAMDFNNTYVQGAKGAGGLRTMRSELDTLKEHAATEMQRKVLSKYKELAGLSGHIEELEMQMSGVRQAVHALTGINRAEAGLEPPSASSTRDFFAGKGPGLSREGRGSRWQGLLDALDISIGEKKTHHALQILRECEAFLEHGTALNAEKARQSIQSRRGKLVKIVVQNMGNAANGSALLKEARGLLELDGELAALEVILHWHAVAIAQGESALKEGGQGLSEALVLQAGAASTLVYQEVSKALGNAATLFKGQSLAWSSHFIRWAKKQLELLSSWLSGSLLQSLVTDGDISGLVGAIEIAEHNCKVLLEEGQGLVLAGSVTKALEPTLKRTVDFKGLRLRACLLQKLEREPEGGPCRCSCRRLSCSLKGLPALKTEVGRHLAAAATEMLDALEPVGWSASLADTVSAALQQAVTAFSGREDRKDEWILVEDEPAAVAARPPTQAQEALLAEARRDAAAVQAVVRARLLTAGTA